ncbi:hypothetical protein SeMB42_g04837 [Synchytrium endobioticum]|uniref:PX domain-containing protein n=1 Tax=Synchytrium endobioticum TaxID=286115 RepID=A0A507DHZ8_9FUNG|nr:hypothetical protein SeMB42_g04837 [Synchytrium endobioticum]TPX50857.1 hypothetical protein SeLEV6574_g00655 [Synchytrium endobioticum]
MASVATSSASATVVSAAPTNMYDMRVLVTTINVKANDATYQLSATTNIPTYIRTRYAFQRTHAEVERLASALQTAYSDVIVPAPPPPSADPSFLAESVNRFLDRICNHHQLRTSEALKTFIESQFEFVSHQPLLRKAPSTFRFSKMGIATQNTRDDPFFEFARSEVAGIETHIYNMIKLNLDKIVKFEKDQAKSSNEVASKLIGLCTEGDALAGVLKKVAKCFQMADDVGSKQASYLSNTFNDSFTHCLRSVESAQITLQNRLNALNSYTEACKATSKKIQALEKLKAASTIKQDKVDAALGELDDAKKVEMQHRELLKRMTDSIKVEYTTFDAQFQTDMAMYLKNYAERQLAFARNMKAAFDVTIPALRPMIEYRQR